ncbi:MAG TPA: aldehyde dehydrogenase family protein [Chitinophagales bacterium]|nr:aldehyde dehydrogenase family protein [Chitinophagales bacterium]
MITEQLKTTLKVFNPATGEVLKELTEDSKEAILQKFEKAKNAQKSWTNQQLEKRIECIAAFDKLLEGNINSLALTLTREVGKPIRQSHNEIHGARKRIKFFLENSEKWLADETVYTETGLTEKISYEPLGVIASISAWNYPYLVGTNVFIPALIAGNAVLYKPSEFSTLTGLEIGRLLREAGVSKDVFQVVVGAREAGEALLELPLNGYFFTGSYKTGQYIYERVAPKRVPCQLELGGKDPLYVAADNKDLKAVAAAAADGAFYNNGQSCCAVERIYVHEKVYDEFVKRFVEEVKSFKSGNPENEDTYIGAITRKQQVDFLQKQVDDAVKKGAKVLIGGKKIEGNGNHFEPTVLVDVNHTMSVMKDESFGPVIGIQKVKNDEEAVQLMQDTEYGLTAAVYSDHRETAEKILKQIDAGTVYWNCCDRVSANLPWSGRNHSGFGTTLSYIGIRAFVKPKAYHLREK